MKQRPGYIYYAAIGLFVVAAYWQVALLRHPLRWDAMDQVFPWRYFIGECVRSGRLPLWNPYEQCGYPFFADPQGSAWYPIALLSGLFTRYSIYVFQLEFILTIFIGSTGMYRLVRSLVHDRATALFGAMCFAACGFFVSNAEHISWIVAAAWLTWLLWAYHGMLQTLKYGYALLCAIFLSLMLSGGYPAFIIITAYIMLAFFTGKLIARQERHTRISLLKVHVVFACSFLLLASINVICFAEASHFITRGGGVTLGKANGMPFSPQCSLSFLLPFASIRNDALFGTDISMRNAYFGIIGLVLVAVGLSVRPRGRVQWAVIIISLLCLLISFGPYLPLRRWLYEYVPLMDLFRFPALFRLFFIIGGILIAAGAFRQVTSDPVRYRARLTVVIMLFIVLLAGLVGYELRKYGLTGNYKILFSNTSKFLETSLFYQHIIIQGMVQLVLLGLFLFMVRYNGARLLTARNMLLLCAIDLVLATQLNAYGTTISTAPSRQVYDAVQRQPQGFPVPDNIVAVAANNDDRYRQELAPLNSNLNIFKKTVGRDGYDPFVLSNFEQLDESRIKDSVWQNPYLYLSYNVAVIDTGSQLAGRTTAAVSQEVYDSIGTIPFRADAADRVIVSSFGPGEAVATTHTAGYAILILQQSGYPGWKVWVDGKPVSYFTTAYANISLAVQPGTHQVVYKFRPRYLLPVVMIGIGALAGIIVCLIVFRKRLF